MTLLNVREIAAGARSRFLSLLYLADDSTQEVASYLDEGRLFVLDDPSGDALPEHQALALALLVPGADPKSSELRSIAVAESAQRRGHGRRLLDHIVGLLSSTQVRRLEVATATCDLKAMTFYLRLGFRPSRIDRDYFGPERGYAAGTTDNGIILRDRIWLDLDL